MDDNKKRAGTGPVQENRKGNLPENETSTQISDFMYEQIKQRPADRQKLVRTILLTAGLAAVFGLIACICFVLAEPLINSALVSQESSEAISFGGEVTEEIPPEDLIADDSEIAAMAASRTQEEIRAAVEEVLKQENLTAGQYGQIYEALDQIAKGASRSVVEVSGITSDQNWWGDTYENSRGTAGFIAAQSDSQILVLAQVRKISDASSIRITFCSGESADAQLLRTDSVTGYGILSVSKSDLKEDTRETIQTASLGVSGEKLTGHPVIALGRPSGVAGSVIYGIVSGREPLDITDSGYVNLVTDMYGSSEASGVLVDLNGKVVGIIDSDYNRADMPGILCGIGISELRSMITALVGGETRALLGIHGQDIPEEIQKRENLPAGVYVSQVEMDSPAMTAGIVPGDILYAVGENAFTGISALTEALFEASPGDTVLLKYYRAIGDSFEEMSVQVTLE